MSTRHGGAGGAIVNLSSAASRLGSPGQYLDYAAAKGAIDAFTIGLAKEVAAEGIRVNAVRPGLIETEIHASGGLPDRVRRPAASGADAAWRHGRRSRAGDCLAALGCGKLHHHEPAGCVRRALTPLLFLVLLLPHQACLNANP